MKVFVDTSGLVALYDTGDSEHAAAALYREDVRSGAAGVLGFVISDYVLDESITLVRVHAGHRPAVALLDSVQGSPFYQLVEVDRETFDGAAELFRRHDDKRWSFTDCTSFVMMKRLGLTEAFAFDRNFEQAGFTMAPLVVRGPKKAASPSSATPSSSAPPGPAASPRRGTPGSRPRRSTRARTPTRS